MQFQSILLYYCIKIMLHGSCIKDVSNDSLRLKTFRNKPKPQNSGLNLTFLPVHVSVDFAGQEASFVDGSVRVMGDVQERVTAAADATDALRVMVLISQLRQRLLQLISITRTQYTHPINSDHV